MPWVLTLSAAARSTGASTAMPETFIIDGKGRVAYKHVGPMNLRSLNEKVLPAIAAAQKGD